MFRLKSFSEKSQPIEESLTKPQVKEVFSNNNFKIGLEFEFYNENFLEDTNRATSEEAIALTGFISIIKEALKGNKEKKGDEKIIYKITLADDAKYKIILFFNSTRGGNIRRKELEDLIYFFITDEGKIFTRVKKSDKNFQEDVIQRYQKDRKRYTEFLSILKNVTTTPKFDEIRNFYHRQELPKCVGKPIITKSLSKSSQTKWIIKLDDSVYAQLGGIEFISPPMNIDVALKSTKEMFDFIQNHGNTESHYTTKPDKLSDTASLGQKSSESDERTAQCGLHMNISFSPDKMKRFDPLKFILFSNEEQVKNEKLFDDRKDAAYMTGVLSRLKKDIQNVSPNLREKKFDIWIKENMNKGKFELAMGTFKHADKYSAINMSHYVKGNISKIRKSSERIEIRYFGGQDYEKKYDLFKRVLSELLYALDVATDPEKEKQKYQKKVFRLLNTINKSKDK